jgi:putative peptidoglycan lipid II flippase
MARAIAGGRLGAALRSVREFRLAASAVWIGTAMLAAIILIWFPALLLKHNYDGNQVIAVVLIWAAIMAVRLLRAPEAILLQAANEFRPLAYASVYSSAVSLTLTLVLVLLFGPVASMFGILSGEIALSALVIRLSRQWRRRHG